MNDAERLHDAARSSFEALCGAFDDASFERRDGYDLVLFPQVPIPQFNAVWPVDDLSTAAALPAAIAEIESLGISPGVLLRDGRAPASAEAARALGLTAEEAEPGMAVATGDLVAPEVPDLEVLRISTPDGLAQALAVAVAGFEVPVEMLAPLYGLDVKAVEGMSVYLGHVEGRDVSTSVGLTQGETVGIFNVATPPEHRGRGYGAALTAAAAQEGFDAGADLAWLQSSQLGLPVYRRLGFREVETYVLHSRPSLV
jgi:ribosomal protein S18 acetylase RimI-like enzyme